MMQLKYPTKYNKCHVFDRKFFMLQQATVLSNPAIKLVNNKTGYIYTELELIILSAGRAGRDN